MAHEGDRFKLIRQLRYRTGRRRMQNPQKTNPLVRVAGHMTYPRRGGYSQVGRYHFS